MICKACNMLAQANLALQSGTGIMSVPLQNATPKALFMCCHNNTAKCIPADHMVMLLASNQEISSLAR